MNPRRDARTFVRSYPSHASFATNARKDLRAFAESMGVRPGDVDDITVAVGEVLIFAVQRGANRSGSGFAVAARATNDTFEIVIRDSDSRFGVTPAVRDPGGDALTPRGYSMQIIRQVVDRVTFSDAGKKVRLLKRLRR